MCEAKCRFVTGLLIMNLLLSKQLQVICLIFVQNLICCVHGDQFAAGIERLLSSEISAHSLGSRPFTGDPLGQSELKPSNDRRLVQSVVGTGNSIRSKRELVDRAAGSTNLQNNVLNANVTNPVRLSAKLNALSGLSESLIDFDLFTQSNAKSSRPINGLHEPLQRSRRTNELANDRSNRSTKSAAIDAAHQSRTSRGVSGSVRETGSDRLLDNGPVEVEDEEEDELYEIPNYLIVILTICYITISLCAIIGNLMVLYIVIKSKKMQNPTNYLLANLSASDFLIGKVSFP